MDIIRVIQETATWIEKVNNDFEVNLFRSEELSPGQHFYNIADGKKASVISRIVDERSRLLNETHHTLIPVDELENYGRIMFFDANSTVLDGAPEDISLCYIDIGDAPPWDTWLATGSQLNEINLCKLQHELKNDLLIAWVPKAQYYYADQAVQLACIDNFEWPGDEYIRDDFNAIKLLFRKPDEMPGYTEPIPYEQRQRILYNMTLKLDKNALPAAQYKKIKKPLWKRVLRIS